MADVQQRQESHIVITILSIPGRAERQAMDHANNVCEN